MTKTNFVLVVEDEHLVASVVGEGLAEAGFAVDLAHSAQGGIAAFDAAPDECSALVTDIDLGVGMTGWDLARHVRSVKPQLPVIYMTGASSSEWASMGVPNSQLLPKPFVIAQLVSAVSQLINAVANLPPPEGQPPET